MNPQISSPLQCLSQPYSSPSLFGPHQTGPSAILDPVGLSHLSNRGESLSCRDPPNLVRILTEHGNIQHYYRLLHITIDFQGIGRNRQKNVMSCQRSPNPRAKYPATKYPSIDPPFNSGSPAWGLPIATCVIRAKYPISPPNNVPRPTINGSEYITPKALKKVISEPV